MRNEERMTHRIKSINDTSDSPGRPALWQNKYSTHDAVNRLTEYEDTGLSPAEVRELQLRMDVVSKALN